MTFRTLLGNCLNVTPGQAGQSQTSPAANFDVQKLADNVYAVVRKEPPGLMVDANNLLIVRDRDVVVVDSNGAPVITREVLGALRKITNKPVRYVINTHYHDDHIRGNQVYRDAFPGVDFIAHSFARDYLPNQGAANRKAFLEGAPQFANQLRGLIKDGKSLLGGELSIEERESLSSDVALADLVLRDGASAETVLPTITVDDRMTLPGQPAIEVLHVGKGHTAADLIVHLPALRIVATGDLVVWPVPLVGDPQSHIGNWSSALDAIQALKPAAIVPGHGPVLRNDEYLATLSSMFADIQRQVVAAKGRGETLEQARQSVNLDAFRARLTGDSPVRRLLFSMYVTRPAIGAAYAQAPRGILLH
jgi:glyoxylase-like metal-dependent hydrolase (beta-lactamase superfamily II)